MKRKLGNIYAGCEESIKTDEKCLEKTDILEKGMKNVDQADEFSDRAQGLDEGIR